LVFIIYLCLLIPNDKLQRLHVISVNDICSVVSSYW